MRSPIFTALAVVALLTAAYPALADGQDSVAVERNVIASKIRAKVFQGKTAEADFADELKEFDALLASHNAEKTDEVAAILYAEAMFYQEVLTNFPKSIELIQQLKRDFPETAPGKNADELVALIKTRQSLLSGAKFPDFNEKDLAGNPLSPSNYKGKVVLIDFWATWCGPCVGELPNLIKAYEQHHPDGFEIIGVSLDSDEQKLRGFLEQKKVAWPQFFDGKAWKNKLALKYGIRSVPSTFLLDREGKIIGKNLHGNALDEAVVQALVKK